MPQTVKAGQHLIGVEIAPDTRQFDRRLRDLLPECPVGGGVIDEVACFFVPIVL